MKIWFIRSNGDTAHNNPNDKGYVPGEPPSFPLREFNYRKKCLEDGFVRYGWPNTGDLREKNPIRLAPNSYSFDDLETRFKNILTAFSSIKAGDLILIPADGENRGDVHLGIALTINREKIPPYIEPRPNAYYYFHDIPNGDWYDCAHRVNVLWAQEINKEFSIFNFKAVEKSHVWRRAFYPVTDEDGEIYPVAQKASLF